MVWSSIDCGVVGKTAFGCFFYAWDGIDVFGQLVCITRSLEAASGGYKCH
jgi:hypothetical protein